MKARRNAGSLILSLMAAFFLYACGGGGGGGAAPPAPPSVTTSEENDPSIDTALVNGNVNPNGLEATAWFEYGEDPALASFDETAHKPVGFGMAPLSMNETLTGLKAATTYYYLVAASNSAGTAKGGIASFATLSLRPTVVTATHSPGADNAVVTGSVNPNGLATTAWFEYGQDPLLTNPTRTDNQAIGSGTLPVPINETLAGLNTTTTYYWRAAASNAEGTSEGSIRTFETTPIPPPMANAGTDQSVFTGQAVVLDGSGSSDPGGGTITSYSWTQPGGTAVTLSDNTVANPTFTAPSVSSPSEVLTFLLTVTSDRVGAPSATDSVDVTVNWGVSDDFSTDTTGDYVVDLIRDNGGAGTFEHDAPGQRALVSTGDDVVLRFSRDVPPSGSGVFSLDFSPIVSSPTHAGIWVRLIQNPLTDNTFYQISNFDWSTFGFPPEAPDLAAFSKFVGGVEVERVDFPTSYLQGSTYHLKITFGPTVTTMEAFGQRIDLSGTAANTVGKFEVHTGQQDAYYDNIRLEAAP